MSFIKLLFWIFIIYLITRLIRFSFYLGKIQNNKTTDYQSAEEAKKKEGTTTIKYIPDENVEIKKKTSSKDDDYIDYEEVK